MLKSNVIYFPYINVPSTSWFTRILLYWDSVYSIVPSDHAHDRARLQPHMLELMDAGIVKPILPMNFANSIQGFTREFLSSIDSDSFPVKRGVIASHPPTFRVHIEKVGDIGSDLCERGLARQLDYPWYEIEAYTARAFMLYLTGCLGAMAEVESDPITDDDQSIRPLLDQVADMAGWRPELDRLRYAVLDEVLPAPSSAVSPSQLARFKERHGSDLRRFRLRVEGALRSIAGIESQTMRQEALDALIGEIREEVNACAEILQANGWSRITLGKVVGCCAVVSGVAAAVPTGGLSLVASVLGGAQFVHESLKRQADPATFAAYCVAASREFSR